QIELEGLDLGGVRSEIAAPETSLRGMFTFLHNADCEADWFHSRDHWSSYFDLLARSRYNSFQIVMAHQTSYLAPPFPFFIDVPEYPDVRVPTLTTEERERNEASLRMITQMSADHGLDFVLGIWQVTAWRPDSRGGHTQISMVDGLDEDVLQDYTYRATARMLQAFPAISGIQIRVNGESGIPPVRQTEFFAGSILRAIEECPREVTLDLRGWIALPETIDAATDLGIPMRLSMKYWAEHLGAPYQAAMQEPAYSYADFLRRGRPYDIVYQVWTLGSHRHFVWGDPGFVRTFARSLRLGDGIGFEIAPPLAQKGYGNQPGAWRILTPDYEYYTWEWERYWSFYLLFGRLTYNAASGAESWSRRLRERFGADWQKVHDAYVAASGVVSFLIRFNMSDPNMYIWPEADTGGLLDFYLSVPPSDPAMIASFSEAVAERLSGVRTARLSPPEASAHLDGLGSDCLSLATQLRKMTPPAGDRRELVSTAVDIEALGELALYHASKILAASALALYYATGDLASLLDARVHLCRATPHWQRLTSVTSDVYTEHQVTGPIDSGHWKDKLTLVIEDEERIEERIDLHRRYGAGLLGGAVAAFDFGAPPEAAYSYTRVPVHHDMVERGFIGVDGSSVWRYPMETPWGWDEGSAVTAVAAPLARFCDRHLDTVFRDTMHDPGYADFLPFKDTLFRDYVHGPERATFHVVVPSGQYEVIALFCDRHPEAKHHGPFQISVNGARVGAPVEVAPDILEERRSRVTVERGVIAINFEPAAGVDWFCSALIVRPLTPTLTHIPPHRIGSSEDLDLVLSISSPGPVADVTAWVDGHDWAMATDGDGSVFRVRVPRAKLPDAGTVPYSFRVRAADGIPVDLPADDGTSPRRTYTLRIGDSGATELAVDHDPIEVCSPGRAITVVASVDHDAELVRTVLHYRYANQYYEWQHVGLTRRDGRHVAQIPGAYVVPQWDIMYYIELVDALGNHVMAPGLGDLNEIPYWVVRVEP
ncbi:MAG TPA: hypothetical protein VLA29_13070, partial [Acidimicrobiia bacterium]|nr:hypothetical protein [Acidimicrobiia bacterium]